MFNKVKKKKEQVSNKLICPLYEIEKFDAPIKRTGHSKTITLPPTLVAKNDWKVGTVLTVAVLKKK